MLGVRDTTRLVTVTIAACLLLAACGDVRGNLRDFSTRIDSALGIAPSARYDLLTDGDVKLAVAAMQSALETRPDGEALSWRNDRSGNAGEIKPVKTYMTELGVYCREYSEVVTIAGEAGEADNTGCRRDDGTWLWLD